MQKTPSQKQLDKFLELFKLKRYNEAEKIAVTFTEKFPKFSYSWKALGVVLKKQNKIEQSLKASQKAIEINPNDAEAHFNVGNTFKELNRLKDSEISYKKAINLKSDYLEAYNNLGTVLRELGRLEESEASYKKAIEIKPDFADAYNNLSLTMLTKHNFNQAFELSEWRWKSKIKIGDKLQTKKPHWNGEKNSSILVWKEQGIGDEIMYCSILPELIEQSKKIILNCDKRLIPLFKRSFPNHIIYESEKKLINEDNYDYHIPMGSLPRFFRNNIKSFNKSSKGYLKAYKLKTLEFRKKLNIKKNNLIIGISWHTKSIIQMASFRNVILKDFVTKIFNSNIKFVNLQYGDVFEEIKDLKNETGIDIINFSELNKKDDLDGIASLVSACDVVISIDNFILHLAGSLGIQTKALLPFSSDARWGQKGKECYLYDSVHFYRQARLGYWESVLNQIKEDINQN